MAPQIIGENLLARDEKGRLRTRIATVFPRQRVIVTLPGIHATQRLAVIDALAEQRRARGLPALTECEFDDLCLCAVDLVLEDGTVLIRPDPEQMDLAFAADELLQELVPKANIKFLHVLEPRVREAIKRRGECWRINSLPRSPEQMLRMIASSRIGIEGREIYYYNNTTGTRFLTCQEFGDLSSLGDPELRRHLLEIRDHCTQTNRFGCPEIEFFAAEGAGLPALLAALDWASMAGEHLRKDFASLARRFHDAVRPEFRRDEPHSPQWRSRMYAALIGQTDKAVSEEALLGLSAEFFMQVEWLPGGRIEDGELIFDPIFEEEDHDGAAPGVRPICDEKARGFIFNFVRDYGDLEYVNICRVAGSLSSRSSSGGRRGVYLAEVKQRNNDQIILRIIRMQKWGVCEHLDEGKDLLAALVESDQYTEYILDRRLGCRQLGMNLPPRVTARKIGERYDGTNQRYRGMPVWSAYFERDYVAGLATDKVPTDRLADARFADALARLLGRAAAPNLVVGRSDLQGNIIFDDGDELLIDGPDGLPVEIIVSDPTGTFNDYRRELRDLAPAYALSVNKRIAYLENPRRFADVMIGAFVERLGQMQQEYRKRQRAFDTLFKHERRDEAGSFAYRWERVLGRLERADPAALGERMRQNMRLGV